MASPSPSRWDQQCQQHGSSHPSDEAYLQGTDTITKAITGTAADFEALTTTSTVPPVSSMMLIPPSATLSAAA
ncbi:MAG: hypothetical protein IPJ25_08600 [Rhodocyclaceae bacterium]|nr:hypothetical protein [Rhodocyclaceae bacterium]